MANEEHLKILKQGVELWNRWREENPEIRPDLSEANLNAVNLSGADLIEAHLIGVDFRGARLSGAQLIDANLRRVHFEGADLHRANLVGAVLWAADFSQANLSEANLSETDLYRVNLRGANLIGAELSGANLGKTDLRGADLSLADLSRANLTRADLVDANFKEAVVGLTVFANVDLSVIQGLDTVQHIGPSTLGIDTIHLSNGKIPEAFLRGCGLGDIQIEVAKLLNPDLTSEQVKAITNKIHELYVADPVHYHTCFISYSHKDEVYAQRLHNDLQGKGVRCWFAPEDIRGGRKLYEQIDEAIRFHDKLLLVLSEHSLHSEWVMTEIRRARKAELADGRRRLFPIRLVDWETIRKWECFDAGTGKDLALEVSEYFIPDFSNWKDQDAYQQAFDRLLRDLKAEEG